VSLLLIDEAAKVPDDLYASVRPMLAVSRGRLVCLSTPFGQRGFFWREWHSDGPWRRISITHADCPRIGADFVREEERALGKDWVDQEYRCLFTALQGLVYPGFPEALVDSWPRPLGKPVGGIDWGFHNPFAAVWGILDRDDVLWIGWERYVRHCPLHEHIASVEACGRADDACPRAKQVVWYADPSGATEILECKAAGWKVGRGLNAIRPGIAAVTARLRTGRLKVVRPACPNLVAEAQLYRYPTPAERSVQGEDPIDDHNHALGALRYLISRIDHKFLAKLRRRPDAEGAEQPAAPEKAPPPAPAPRRYNPYRDENLWTPL
jgi:hypothetical protein